MPALLNIAYLLGLFLSLPWLLYKSLTTGKYRRGLWCKLFGSPLAGSPSHPVTPSSCHPIILSSYHRVTASPRRPRAWFHGVSVGEIHLLCPVVSRFRLRHPGWDCTISTTTDTGFAEALKRFPDLPVFYWPFDFSWAVRRALRRINPAVVVLAEGEMWPNFLVAAKARRVPVAVINGRMSPRSFRRYAYLRPFVRPLLRRIDLFAVQTEEFARCFRALGVAPERVHVTGSVEIRRHLHGPP